MPDQGVEAAAVMVGDGRRAARADRRRHARRPLPREPRPRHAPRRLRGLDVAVALEQLTAAGAELIDERPRSGLFGLEVAFASRRRPRRPLGGGCRWLTPSPCASRSASTAARSASALVTAEGAEQFERALREDGPPLIALDANDGYTIVLRRVVYLKRFAREPKVGFGSTD